MAAPSRRISARRSRKASSKRRQVVLSHPATVDTIPTDGNKEDVVPMSMGAAWKLRRVVHNVRHILAIELLCAMQGIDFRRPLRAGAGVERAYREVRALVPMLERDRPHAPDIARIAEAVAAGRFVSDAPASGPRAPATTAAGA